MGVSRLLVAGISACAQNGVFDDAQPQDLAFDASVKQRLQRREPRPHRRAAAPPPASARTLPDPASTPAARASDPSRPRRDCNERRRQPPSRSPHGRKPHAQTTVPGIAYLAVFGPVGVPSSRCITATDRTVRSATSRRSGSRAGSARSDSMKVRAPRRRSLRRRARATTSTAHLRRGPNFGGRPRGLAKPFALSRWREGGNWSHGFQQKAAAGVGVGQSPYRRGPWPDWPPT
jgi:hypothetical protein